MKIKFISIISLALVLFATACDDYLDVMPDNRTELDSEDKITKLLANASPGKLFVCLTEWASDNTDWRDNISYTAMNQVQEDIWNWRDGSEVAGNDNPQAYWADAYSNISTANHALQAIEKLGNPQRLDPQRGEALMIRAYNHFYLVNVFAKNYSEKTSETDLGVPYADTPETTVDPYYERASVAEVYRRIDADLKEALPLIDDNLYTVPKYHFNLKACYAFATRFYLFYKKYDEVIKYASLVLGENPKVMLRDMTAFVDLPSGLQDRARYYAKMDHNTNLMICAPVSAACTALGNYGTGKKYCHTTRIASAESTQSAGPWGLYTGTVFYQPGMNYTQYVASPKIPYYFEYTDPVAGVGYQHSAYVIFSADEVLLCRAEAYIHKQEYDKAVKDLGMWMTNYTTSGVILTRDLVNEFYGNPELNYYIPEDPTCKKKLNPETPIVSAEQENFFHCLLHMRRIETIHEGLRWFDVKRFGIEIHRRKVSTSENITVLDVLKVDDPRRAIQLPATVIKAGLAPNPR